MPQLSELIRDYCEVLDLEQQLAERKTALRRLIIEAMTAERLPVLRSAFGSAERVTRFKLHPRRDEVLQLLASDDLFPFAQFTPAKVKTVLVPKYGRERLVPLFDIEKSESVTIKRANLRRDGRG
jgi:hypothetical protein